MGIYGIDFYGVGHFGPDPATVRPDFSVAPFTSNPLDYSTLHIQWTNPPSNDCEYLRLVRNPRNLPQDEDDGFQVFDYSDLADTVPEAPSTVFGDPSDAIVTRSITALTDMWLPAGFQYYSMFGWSFSEQMWIRCSDLIALVPINWGYGQRLYDLLPMAYRDNDIILVDPYNPWPVDSPNPPLQRYLQLIGFQFDFIRTELESLMSINDPQNCSGALLPVMMQQLGLVHEPEMGMQQERQLAENAVHLYKTKGSPQGIREFASILTSYPSTQLVHHGYNCLLTTDDGAMLDGIGTWQLWPPRIQNPYDPNNPTDTIPVFPTASGQANGQTITWISNLSAAGTTPPLETFGPPANNNFPPLKPPYSSTGTGMRLMATSAGDLYATTGAIPITDFMSGSYTQGHITFTIQIWSSVQRSVKLSVWGDAGTGTPFPVISESATFTETAGHWTQMTATYTLNPYSKTTPGNPVPQGAPDYYWLYPRIHVLGAAANEPHYVTLCALWPCTPTQVGKETLLYEYPRDVKVLMQPTASNLLPNTLTTFSRTITNPDGTTSVALIGFDGLSPLQDPKLPLQTDNTQPSYNPYTATLVYRPEAIEDPPELLPVHGNAALEVDVNVPNATVWFGTISSWSPAPPTPLGWFAVDHQWFDGAVQGANARPWFDPVYSWFMVNQQWFGVGSGFQNGLWFSQPAQPTIANPTNLLPFQVNAGQPFNFSVYAQYLSVQAPSNAAMMLGFRWYYPDGTWVEVTNTQQITEQYLRYSIAPENGPFSLSDPPTEAITGVFPTTVYPFVRFPVAQQARFLLNSAMLSPTETLPPYMDASSYSSASGDFISDPTSNASYEYPRRTPRIARLNMELYRWLPMGSTYTITYASAAVTPPLDPTLWP